MSDPQKKAAYDQYGHDAFTPGGGFNQGNPFAGQQSGGFGPFTYTYTSQGGNGQNPFGDFGDPFEIFEQFFGGGSPFGRSAKRIPRYSLSLDFMEAVRGVEKEVSIEGKARKIKIPAGVDTGSRINFNDFTLTINVQPDKNFQRDGDDIYVTKLIPYSLAILGGEVSVPTVNGEIKIRVRPGTQAGTMVRLREQGVVHLHGRGKGDQYVRITLKVPDKITGYQREIVEELKKEGL